MLRWNAPPLCYFDSVSCDLGKYGGNSKLEVLQKTSNWRKYKKSKIWGGSVVFDERIRNLCAMIVRNARSRPFHVLHQSIKIVA